MPINPHSLTTIDPDHYSGQIASWLERNPSKIAEALQVLDRWEAWGQTHPEPIQNWRIRLRKAQESEDCFAELINYLRTPNHDAEPLKSCSPLTAIFSSNQDDLGVS